MADARRYDDDIAALQAVTLRSDQIIQTAAVAVDQFIKGVTVKLHFVPGGADVFVRIHISGEIGRDMDVVAGMSKKEIKFTAKTTN